MNLLLSLILQCIKLLLLGIGRMVIDSQILKGSLQHLVRVIVCAWWHMMLLLAVSMRKSLLLIVHDPYLVWCEHHPCLMAGLGLHWLIRTSLGPCMLHLRLNLRLQISLKTWVLVVLRIIALVCCCLRLWLSDLLLLQLLIELLLVVKARNRLGSLLGLPYLPNKSSIFKLLLLLLLWP